MGETIESMINVLKSQIEFLKDKVKYNNLCSRGSLDQFKNLDKEEKVLNKQIKNGKISSLLFCLV